jgi:hypothetical protein
MAEVKRRGGAPKGERVPLNARPRPKREQMATSDCVARPHGTVAPFRRSASPYFFGGKSLVALVGKTRAQVRRENGIAFLSAPAQRGRGTTGAREASEPWWRGRRTRSFIVVAGR